MSGTIDNTVALNAGKGVAPIANPLQLYGNVANTVNALQTLGARQAIGPIYQQSINPQTGELDTNKLLAAAAANPRTAFMAGDLAAQALARQKDQLAIQTGQFELAQKRINGLQGRLASLLAQPSISRQDVIRAAVDWQNDMNADPNHPTISSAQVAGMLAGVPDNPAAIRPFLQEKMMNTLDAKQRLDAMMPAPTPITAGGTTQLVRLPQVGAPQAVGQIKNTLSPGEQAQRVPTFQNGHPGSVPMASVAPPDLVPGSGVLGNGRYPGPQGEGQEGQGGGFLPSGPSLGQEAAANKTGTASAEQGIELQKAASTVPQQKALLGNLESALGQFTSGPGADWTKVAKAFVNRQSPFGAVFDPKSIASQEEFAKQAFQLAQQQFQALGGTGTDSKLDSTMHTSPSELLSKMGNQGIIHLLKGNADAISAMNDAWQNKWLPAHGGDTATYGQFATSFNKQFDPRVFQSVYMNPEERQEMLKGISKPELPKFQKSYNEAVDNGWIPDPRSGGANGAAQ